MIIINETNKYNTKEITTWTRQQLKNKYPQIKMSITCKYYSGGSNMNINILESKKIQLKRKFEELSQDEKERLKHKYSEYYDHPEKRIKEILELGSINHISIEDDWTLTEKGKEIIGDIIKIANTYNYDNSDPMTDYFDVNYYFNISLGKYSKPFIDANKLIGGAE